MASAVIGALRVNLGGLSLDAYSTALATHGTSTNAATMFSSIFVMGDILAANAKSAMINGDSLSTGWVVSGQVETGSAKGEKGLARIPDALGWGYFNASSRGGTPAGWATNLYPKILMVALVSEFSPSHAIIQTGINDVTSKTTSALLAERATMRTDIAGMIAGIEFIDTTLTTAVNTPADTTSEATQTIAGGPSRSGPTNEFNDGIRDLAEGGATVLWDIADITMTSRNSCYWKPGFVADGTSDALHMIAAGYAACATAIYAAPGV